ncbi:membrane-associated protein, putative [Bodo saltans]|uniref:Membrane-associated protein, putative n=1 Tax=Bodo saltans TaxID=75058 RepID=A0A0S4JY67_BODSA|nr:membrane-associated protein, putative [Bodo saltans]|eukprot:CUG93541.1 membrane-associated protein, putative [Bodo saltans]
MIRRWYSRQGARASSLSVALVGRSCATKPPQPTVPQAGEVSAEEVDRIVAALEKSESLMEDVVSHMQPSARRRLVVAGGTLEWFGKEHVAREVAAADSDKDHVISPKDFDHWFANALKRKDGAEAAVEGGTAAAASSDPRGVVGPVPLAALFVIALEAGLPFVGFGFLDNATMILAGDFIDRSLGFYLGCSVMASAAMGNVVSGVMGMQVHGLVEKAVQRLGLKMPVLTEEQQKGRRVFLAGHLGGTLGIMLGLTLGMMPLLFIKNDEAAKSDIAAFQKWDRDNSGFLEVAEIVQGLKEVGFQVNPEAIERVVAEYSSTHKLNIDQFRELCSDLRRHKHAHVHLTTA